MAKEGVAHLVPAEVLQELVENRCVSCGITHPIIIISTSADIHSFY